MRHADGFTLVELLVGLVVGAVVGTLLLGTLTAQLRLARTTAQYVTTADAYRTTMTILGGEMRRTLAADVRAITRDSAALRAFRGSAVICGPHATGIAVSYRGDRLPDTSKDSALAVALTDVRPVAIRSMAPDPAGTCSDAWGGSSQLWRVDPPVAAGVLLIFESGNYYLTGRALRYRLGAEGRQPLTADLFVHPATGFLPRSADALRFELATAALPLPGSFAAYAPVVLP